MRPTDPSDSHLADRIVEIRVLKSIVVLGLVALGTFFYPWTAVITAFAVVYVAYMFRYYRRRVGAYTNDSLTVQYDNLEYGVLGSVGVTVGVLIATQFLFPEEWELGGFLSLPAVEFTDFNAVLTEPVAVLAWVAVILPVAAVSYVGLQLRKRLLVGLTSTAAAVRATIWDALCRIPIAILWVAVLNMRPLYEVFEPTLLEVSEQVGLTLQTTTGFAVVFGDAFEPLVIGSICVPAAVAGSYLLVQQGKYDDMTVPEVVGYRGLSAPFHGLDRVNVIVPVAVYVLYVVAVIAGVGTVPVGDLSLLAGVAVAATVGADLLARTTTTVSSLSETVGDNVDAVIVGLAGGFLVLLALGQGLGTDQPLAAVALGYPVVAIPAAYGSNWLVGRYVARQLSAYSERLETADDAFDESTVDRLFIYSRARDNSLRGAAVSGLASAMGTTRYRKEEAIGVMQDAIGSNEDEIVHAGLRGITVLLGYDRSTETYDRLASADTPELIASYLDSENERTQLLAAQALARVYAAEIGAQQSVSPGRLDRAHVSKLDGVAESNTDDPQLIGAVAEYFASLWYLLSRGDDVHRTDDRLQHLLGSALRMSDHSDGYTRGKIAFAVTGEHARADQERFELALENLDSPNAETRYMAAHVVRSSLRWQADHVDSERLAALLEDPSPAVRRIGAATLVTLLEADPDRGSQLRDRLLRHLEENQANPGRTERSVLQTLAKLDAGALVSHPSGPLTVASYVEAGNPVVAGAAAQLLRSLVEASRGVSQQASVRAAVEAGLTHRDAGVRVACLEAVAVIVDHSVENGQQFVEGLGANLGVEGRQSVLAAVTLAEILGEHPDAGIDIVPDLAGGLRNQTPVDTQSIPFLVRGATVSAVTVGIVEDVITLDPSQGEPVIEPLLDLATAVDQSTLGSVLGVLEVLSEEFPTESQAAVQVAAVGIEEGSMSIRRDAAQVLANVAAYHPEAVEPYVDHLLVAIEDNNPRVRATALVALRNVCTAIPDAIESDVHRIIGRLDDDSAVVRKQAADLISTVADRDPGLIKQEAEAADRLRRLQRDPAVDLDAERLQDASTAIQTGVSPSDDDSGDSEEIWTPESSDEMGVSGDTNVFEPIGDEFDSDFDDEFEEPAFEESTESTDEIEDRETVIDSDGETDDVEDQETVIDSDEPSEGVGDTETVIDSEATAGGTTDHETDSKSAGMGERETVIESDDPDTGTAETDPASDTDDSTEGADEESETESEN